MISLVLAAAIVAGARSEHVLPQFTVKQSGGGLGGWVEETAVFAGVYPSRQASGESYSAIRLSQVCGKPRGREAGTATKHQQSAMRGQSRRRRVSSFL